MRENVPDGTPFESVFGYTRAVRVGNMVFVSGTVGWGPEGRVDRWEDIARAHREAFGSIARDQPHRVNRLAAPEMLVEIEADAVLEGSGAR